MAEGLSAVAPGTDLPRYARLLAAVHDAVLAGTAPPVRPRALVARSWSRMRTSGLSPERCGTVEPVAPAEVERRRRRTALRAVLPELRTSLAAIAQDAQFVMVVADADGVLLWREGSSSVLRGADVLGFTEGAEWSERTVGTNAIGTALVEAAPVQLFSAEHYAPSHHGWTCTGCPVHDPRTGEMLGVVDLSGPALTVHPMTIALVCTAVRLAEATLWRQHEARLDRLRLAAGPALASVNGPAMVVDEHGWVAGVSGLASRERVAVPAADRPLAVPGVGLCVPEPLAGGWLLRGSSSPTPLRLELELGAQPQAVVHGASTWRHRLTTRHAELLLLLAKAGATGMDAAALSCAIYGDAAHVVAVRAEVSRLRRTLGGLLCSQPYRFAPEVVVTLPGLDGCALLRTSTAPGVRAMLTERTAR
ncbi:MAG: GAF domain-containing protein [Mycobacteriaceae bacterium]